MSEGKQEIRDRAEQGKDECIAVIFSLEQECHECVKKINSYVQL